MDDLFERLAAPVPSPAAGSAAAWAAAMGASIVEMVGRGSPGWPEGPAAAASAHDLRAELVALAEEDVEAFGTVLDAYRLPDGDATRADAMAVALVRAAEVPRRIAEAAARVAELAAAAAQAGKPPMRPDARAAAALAATAARIAAALVSGNLTALPAGAATGEAEPLLAASAEARERAERSAAGA